jgi:sarcosine oxidase subunit gamma
MSDAALRRHGLEAYLASLGDSRADTSTATLEILPELDHLMLRGNAQDPAFVETVTRVLGQPLPLRANTLTRGNGLVFWTGPDERQIVTGAGQATGLIAQLREALAGQHASVTDVSGGHLMLALSGAGARDILSSGSTLDFHPRAFAVDDCAQTNLAKAAVLIALVGDEPSFRIVVRRSFAEYLLRWMHHAGREVDLRMVVSQQPAG